MSGYEYAEIGICRRIFLSTHMCLRVYIQVCRNTHIVVSSFLHTYASSCLQTSMQESLYVDVSQRLHISMQEYWYVDVSSCLHINLSSCLHISIFMSTYKCAGILINRRIFTTTYMHLHVYKWVCRDTYTHEYLLGSIYASPCLHTSMQESLYVDVSSCRHCVSVRSGLHISIFMSTYKCAGILVCRHIFMYD